MRRSIRLRVTVLAGLAVTLVLAGAGFALVLLQRATLTESIDVSLTQRAEDIETLVGNDSLPIELSPSGTEGFAIVFDPVGEIVAASPRLEGEPPRPAAPGFRNVSNGDDTFRVYLTVLDDGTSIYLGTPLEAVGDSTSALVSSLLLAIPVVVVAMVGIVWWLVGRTLRPVEDIRTEVAEIGSGQLDRRVPLPGTRDEIERLARTMNEMLSRIEASVAKQQKFVADVSHELRSPLTRLRAGIETNIRTDGHSYVLDDYLVDVMEMQSLVEDMLYLARSDAGALSEARTVIDLDDIVFRHAGLVGVPVDLSGVQPVQVTGSQSQLERAVGNVVSNAARYADSKVTVGLDAEKGEAVLTIEDDGPGIPASAAESVFERFTRLDEARSTQTGGAGLGLAIAREVVESHHGSIRVVNSRGSGAVFEIRLPLAKV